MLTFVIVVMLAAFALIVPIGIKETKKVGFPIVTAFVGAIIVVIAMVIPTAALKITVGDTSEFVTSIDELDSVQQNLYYDNAEERYFIVKADHWDMSKMQYREYLDTGLVEQYLEHKEAIQETKEAIEKIPLFEKGN